MLVLIVLFDNNQSLDHETLFSDGHYVSNSAKGAKITHSPKSCPVEDDLCSAT